MSLFVISHHQAYALVGAHRKGLTTAKTSPDLTLTTIEAALDDTGVFYPDPWNIRLTWEQLEPIAKDETHCFKLVDDQLVKIHTFSQVTNRAISLYPTAAAPTMVLAGFPMHRIKGIDPWEDTRPYSNSPWASFWVPPTPPADGRWVAEATFKQPGTYVLKGRADDGGLFTDETVTVRVRPAS